MALLSDIIVDAYRESNVVAIVSDPTDEEMAEGVDRLNVLIQSVLGSEVGCEFTDINIGGQFDQSNVVTEFIPEDSRLVLNLTGDLTFKLHPQPRDGQRVGVVDGNNQLGTYNVTLDANGRTVEGSASLDLVTVDEDENTIIESGDWFYRADLANWLKVSDLGEDDDFPFPTEYNDYFVLKLAMRLNPRHGATLNEQQLGKMASDEQKMQARYRKRRPQQEMGTLDLMGQSFGSSSAGLLR